MTSFIFFGRHPKSRFANEWALYLVSGADVLRNLRYFSNRVRSRCSQGLPWAPEGRKSTDKSGAGFIFLAPPRHVRVEVLS